jgi:hypothetical protein
MSQLGNLKPNKKGEPPRPQQTVNNLSRTPAGLKAKMQLTIDPELKAEFETEAFTSGRLELSELFEKVYKFWQQNKK